MTVAVEEARGGDYPRLRARFWPPPPAAGAPHPPPPTGGPGAARPMEETGEGRGAGPSGSGGPGGPGGPGGAAPPPAGPPGGAGLALPALPALGGARAEAHRAGLAALDLTTLNQGGAGDEEEALLRKERLRFFDGQCSEVAAGLFVGSDNVARNLELLQAQGVTHVLNANGYVCGEYHAGRLAYRTLYLYDSPQEDILRVLYDALNYIEAALSGGGKVFVHCSQGVSRSCTMCIAYIMFHSGGTYQDVFRAVKAIRGIANPNIGFACQLLQWQKRARGRVDAPSVYAVAPQSDADPQYLVGWAVPAAGAAALDPRGVFVVRGAEGIHIWAGGQSVEPFLAAARGLAANLVKYEAAEGPVAVVFQGQEPPAFWRNLGGGGPGEAVAARPAYDKDFQRYTQPPKR